MTQHREPIVNLAGKADPVSHAMRHLAAAEEWLVERKTHRAHDVHTAALDAIIGVGWALVALGRKNEDEAH